MKNLKTALSLLVVCLLFLVSIPMAHAEDGIAIDEEHFPDASFRSYVAQNCDTDQDGYLSESEIEVVTEIDVSFYSPEITDLTGIEYFAFLEKLNCTSKLTSLDVSANTALTYLNCEGNQLTSLDVSGNTALNTLYCPENQLTNLDVSANMALRVLYCGDNRLSNLDISANTSLSELGCSNNLLADLDVSTNTNLRMLYCGSNQLTSLDLSKNTNLLFLYCQKNHLKSLDLSANTFYSFRIDVSGQTGSAELEMNDGMYRLNFTALVGAENVDRVTVTSVTPADAKYSMAGGVLTSETELTGLTYTYTHGGYENGTMDVTLTLTAKNSTYTIAYDPNGGADAPAAQTKIFGTALTLSFDQPTRNGYYFLGWAESADATASAYLPGGSFNKDEDTTLYAVWAQPDLVLPAALTSIEEEAFSSGAFTFVKLPQQAVSIAKNAFAGCQNLTVVYIPSTVINIDEEAFGNATNLTIIGASGSTAETFAHAQGFAFLVG